jgi:hypothetical protein
MGKTASVRKRAAGKTRRLGRRNVPQRDQIRAAWGIGLLLIGALTALGCQTKPIPKISVACSEITRNSANDSRSRGWMAASATFIVLTRAQSFLELVEKHSADVQ